jgi:drug/metabolite transporter (DMT)-like permease
LLGTTSAWSAGSLYARGAPLPKNPLRAAAMQMLAASVIAASAGLIRGEPSHIHASSFSAESLLAFFYLVTFGSLLAFSAYAWLLKNVRIGTVATYAFVNPVVAVALGAVFLGEPITATTLLAGAAIVLAVVLIVVGKLPALRPRLRARAATLAP